MATIIPFRGVLYDPVQVPDLARVVAPPYDVIDAERQQALHERHPHNIIRLELGLEQPSDDDSRNKYVRAAERLRDWLHAGILRKDLQPGVYFYTIEYRVSGYGSAQPSGPRTLRGFLARVALEEFGTGRILPHEDTRAAAKMDRLKLLESCRANFSPIFSLFPDPESTVLQLLEKSVEAGRPRIEFDDDEGFRHRLWTVTDLAVLHDLRTVMEPKPLFIADGHHRYETALGYRRAQRERAGQPASRQPYDSVMMLISSLEDPGLTVLPTHRVLRAALPAPEEIQRRLRQTLQVEEIPFGAGGEPAARMQLLQKLRESSASHQVFGLARRGTPAYWLLSVKPEHHDRPGASARDRLDVSVLHELILKQLLPAGLDAQHIIYTKDEREALNLVQSVGTAGTERPEAALLLNPTKVVEVQAVAAAGDRMPHKSTYFFPKPMTGLVLNVFDEP
jgi:uncharacterized protein (DUF1015 family)